MTENAGMYQNYTVEGELKLKGDEMYSGCMKPQVICPPIYECPRERYVHKEIMHEVPHVIPINTRIINHHIYKHTYQPVYTCTTEEQICNIGEKPCGL